MWSNTNQHRASKTTQNVRPWRERERDQLQTAAGNVCSGGRRLQFGLWVLLTGWRITGWGRTCTSRRTYYIMASTKDLAQQHCIVERVRLDHVRHQKAGLTQLYESEFSSDCFYTSCPLPNRRCRGGISAIPFTPSPLCDTRLQKAIVRGKGRSLSSPADPPHGCTLEREWCKHGQARNQQSSTSHLRSPEGSAASDPALLCVAAAIMMVAQWYTTCCSLCYCAQQWQGKAIFTSCWQSLVSKMQRSLWMIRCAWQQSSPFSNW